MNYSEWWKTDCQETLYICEKGMEKHIFEALYKEYFPLVFRRCFEILKNNEDAENAANTVFEKLYKKDDVITYPKSYLYRVATNIGLKQIKKRRREIAFMYAEATNVSISRLKEKGEREIKQLLSENKLGNNEGKNTYLEDKGYEQIEAEIIVDAVLKEADETTRVIYVLFYRDDMTYKAIGEIVGLSISAVEKRIKKLKRNIKQKIYEDRK